MYFLLDAILNHNIYDCTLKMVNLKILSAFLSHSMETFSASEGNFSLYVYLTRIIVEGLINTGLGS